MYMYWSRQNVQNRAVACDVAIVQPSVYEVSISLAKALPSRNDREMHSVVIGSVSEATYYRGQMYIDGAARKKDYRMMLCESDTHRHITVKHTLHVHRLRHVDKCARPDTKCDTVQQRSRTRMSHRWCAVRRPHTSPQRTGRHGFHMQPCAACLPCTPWVLPREQRSGLSEGRGSGRDRNRGMGYLWGATEAGGKVVRLNRGS